MKNYNKILEAVNRGIQLALDDFDDEESVQNIKSKQVYNRDYTKEYLDFQKLIIKLRNKELTKPEFNELVRLSKLTGLKYKVQSYTELRSIINCAYDIDHNANLNWIDTSNPKIYTMANLFTRCEEFNGDISEWDVSNVKSMVSMFKGCSKFNQSLNTWDVSKVELMGSMFDGCTNFNQPLDNWDVSNVENMIYMFNNCKSFNQPLNNWNVSSIKNNNQFMMFNGCKIKEEYKPKFK